MGLGQVNKATTDKPKRRGGNRGGEPEPPAAQPVKRRRTRTQVYTPDKTRGHGADPDPECPEAVPRGGMLAPGLSVPPVSPVVQEWVQCSGCGKWRRLGAGDSAAALPEVSQNAATQSWPT